MLDGYRAEFEKGEYQSFLAALLLCCENAVPLPEWVYTLVIRQAEEAFDKHATGPGRTGNWRSQLNRMQIDRHRAAMVQMHLNFRERFGRHYISPMAAIEATASRRTSIRAKMPSRSKTSLRPCRRSYGYGFQGEPGEMRASYKAVKGHGRRKRKATGGAK